MEFPIRVTHKILSEMADTQTAQDHDNYPGQHTMDLALKIDTLRIN